MREAAATIPLGANREGSDMPGSGRIAGPNRQNGLPVFEWAGHVGTANSVLEAADRHFLRINSYASPGDVLRDTNLSAAQKRDALRMWALEEYLAQLSMRDNEAPGNSRRLDELVDALIDLDGDKVTAHRS